MSGGILDGKVVAAGILSDVTERAARLQENDVLPTLAFLMIGDSPPARVYLRRLQRLSGQTGIRVLSPCIAESANPEMLKRAVQGLSNDESIDGVLVQLPLPEHLAHVDLSALLDWRKDVDAITVHNVGRLYLDLPGPRPPTAEAMMDILDFAGIPVTGRHAVVVGRSNVVGHPVAELLLQRDATVSVTHRQTADLGAMTRQADILLVGAGEPGLIRAEMVSPGVVIVDAGINVTEHGVVGDVLFEECRDIATAITPVPGGVGPVTNAVVLRHVIESAEQRHG